MPRIKGGYRHSRKRKRILKRASGFVGQPGKNYRSALEFTRKADVYAYEHRRQKKRLFRALWITRLNAALKERGINYNRFIPALLVAGIELNRKMLSEISIADPATFNAIVEQVKPHITQPRKKVAA
ncbi:MAG TPA: 50S ribosomal protein L20 [Tepidisphaeraceae bacterium]|nr:50S ribosomal protein L20 [Tepidisphaeraceae bacterium]